MQHIIPRALDPSCGVCFSISLLKVFTLREILSSSVLGRSSPLYLPTFTVNWQSHHMLPGSEVFGGWSFACCCLFQLIEPL